jgi:hypothetical protein
VNEKQRADLQAKLEQKCKEEAEQIQREQVEADWIGSEEEANCLAKEKAKEERRKKLAATKWKESAEEVHLTNNSFSIVYPVQKKKCKVQVNATEGQAGSSGQAVVSPSVYTIFLLLIYFSGWFFKEGM